MILQTVPLYAPINKKSDYISLVEAKTGYFIERPLIINPKKLKVHEFIEKFSNQEFEIANFYIINKTLLLIHNDYIVNYENDFNYSLSFCKYIYKDDLLDFIKTGKIECLTVNFDITFISYRNVYIFKEKFKRKTDVFLQNTYVHYFVNPFSEIENIAKINTIKNNILENLVW